jgi:phage replication O-like protein O
MASPQKENGNIQIATEIWERLAKTRIPGEARQVLDWILRKTYGWNKKTDKIALSQFQEGTGLKKTTICKALAKLQEMNLISVTQLGNEIAKEYGFIKDYDQWRPLPKKVMKKVLPKKVTSITQLGNRSLPKKGTTIDTSTIDTTKDTKGDVPSHEVKEVIQTFRELINPHLKFENKTERKASAELVESYGLEKVIGSIKFIASKQGKDQYMPKVTTPYELLTKWAKLKIYFESKNNKKSNVIMI